MPAAQQKVNDPQLEAMLELERRGELPDDLKPQLQMAREQGAVKALNPTPPSTPADTLFSNDEVLRQISKARDLAQNHWTTSGFSMLSSIPGTPSHDLSTTIGGIQSNLALDNLANMRASSPTGGALGNVTEGEERLLADKVGALRQSDSQANFLDNLSAVERNYKRFGLKLNGVDPDTDHGRALMAAPITGAASPPSAGGNGTAPPPTSPSDPNAPPPPPPTAGPVPQPKVLSSDGSGTFSTPQDLDLAAKTQALLKDPRSTRADFDALAQSLGRPAFGPDLDKALQYRAKGGQGVGVATPESGRKDASVLGSIANTSVGAGAVGIANGITAGHLADVVGAVGGDADAARQGEAALGQAHPIATPIGNIVGGAGAALTGELGLGALGVRGGLGALSARGLMADSAYGAASGATGDHPIQGALTGGFLGATGGVLGRSFGSIVSPSVGKLGDLYDAGVRPTLGQRFVNSGKIGATVNKLEEASQSLPILGSLPRAARDASRDQFERGAFNSALGEIGDQLPSDTPLGNEAHAYMQDAFKREYDSARSGMSFVPDAQYQADRQAFAQQIGNGVLSEDQVKRVTNILDNAVTSRLQAGRGALSGDSYKAASSDIGAAARKLSATDPLVSDALNNYGTIFDDAARRNSAPDAVAKLDAADAGYAKAVRVEMAAAARGGDTGRFSPTQFDAAVQKASGGVRSRAYLRGDALMGDYAEAGKSLVDQLPNSGTADRLQADSLLSGRAMTGGVLGALGYAHPVGAALSGLVTLPYAPGIGALTKGALTPRTSQTARTLGDLIRQHGGALGGSTAIYGLSNGRP